MSKSVLAEYLLGVGLMLGPWVSSNLLRLLVGLLLLLLIGWLLVCRPLWLLRLLEGLLLEGGLLVGRLDGLLGSWLVVSLLSAWLLLLVDRGRPLLLNLQYVADNVAFDHADAYYDADYAGVAFDHADAEYAAAGVVVPAGSSGSDSAEEQLLQAGPLASAFSQ